MSYRYRNEADIERELEEVGGRGVEHPDVRELLTRLAQAQMAEFARRHGGVDLRSPAPEPEPAPAWLDEAGYRRIRRESRLPELAAHNRAEAVARFGSSAEIRATFSEAAGALDHEAGELRALIARSAAPQDDWRERLAAVERARFDTTERGVDAALRREDAETYDRARVQLDAYRRMAALSPHGSGAQAARRRTEELDAARLGQLAAREAHLGAAGELTPERRLAIERERATLGVEQARAMAAGQPLALEALSAGAPSFAARLSPEGLLALQYRDAGLPIASAGAANGAQLRAQETAWGRTAHAADLSALEGLLRELIRTVRDAAGPLRGARPGEAMGSQTGGLQRSFEASMPYTKKGFN